MDHLFPKDLQNYIINITSTESALLENLRKETASTVGMANMICGPVPGALLQMLVKLTKAKKCLEIGTFTGYSALNIAAGLTNDGTLITCEVEPKNAALAQKYFDRSPHGHKIHILLGQAVQSIDTLTDSFDFIFVDADKANYPIYYDMLIPKLNQGGLMVVDNALWGGEVIHPKDKRGQAIHDLNAKARQDDRVETVMLSVRDGILLIRKC